MDLHDIQHTLIARSTSDAWFNVPVAGGPLFRPKWEYGTREDGRPYALVIDEHKHYAVFRDNPNLTMSWGMNVDTREDNAERIFFWADKLTNARVRPFWADFFWGGALIDRVELSIVDSGAGLIPIPADDDSLEVTEYEVAVTNLVHGFRAKGPRSVADYIELLEFTVVRDEDRQGAGSTGKPHFVFSV